MSRSIKGRIQALEKTKVPISFEVFQDQEDLELYEAWLASWPRERTPGITYLIIDGVPRSEERPPSPWCSLGVAR